MDKIESLSKFKKLYQDMWIAKDLKTGKVLAAAEKLKDVVNKASRTTKDYSIENVLPIYKAFAPFLR